MSFHLTKYMSHYYFWKKRVKVADHYTTVLSHRKKMSYLYHFSGFIDIFHAQYIPFI